MLPEIVKDSAVLSMSVALGIFGTLLVIAFVINLVMRAIVRNRRQKNPDGLDSLMLAALRGPIVLFLVLLGMFLAFITLTQSTHPSFSPLTGLDIWARNAWVIIVIAEVSYAIAQSLRALIRWYIRRIPNDNRSIIDTKLGPTLSRVLPLIIYAIGALVILDSLGISINPMLAGLGIGGLAVALALTPTITSFIAGTYVVTEGQFKEGDFIELEDGTSGFVIDVGWRSTIVRSFHNNIVVIPNSKLTESIVTNYSTPTPVLLTITEYRVSFDSDLSEVERIALEVGAEVIAESEDSVKDFEPRLRFYELGESNVNFRVIVQATSRPGSFLIKHEILKRLNARFKKEGIVTNYPVRKLLIPSTNGKPELPDIPELPERLVEQLTED